MNNKKSFGLKTVAVIVLIISISITAFANWYDEIENGRWVEIEGNNYAVDTFCGVGALYNKTGSNIYCNELIIRFYKEVFGLTVKTNSGSAPTITNDGYKFEKLSTSDTPSPGDVLLVTAAQRGTNDHWAIVKSYSGGKITLFEQNVRNNGKAGVDRKIKWPSTSYNVYTPVSTNGAPKPTVNGKTGSSVTTDGTTASDSLINVLGGVEPNFAEEYNTTTTTKPTTATTKPTTTTTKPTTTTTKPTTTTTKPTTTTTKPTTTTTKPTTTTTKPVTTTESSLITTENPADTSKTTVANITEATSEPTTELSDVFSSSDSNELYYGAMIGYPYETSTTDEFTFGYINAAVDDEQAEESGTPVLILEAAVGATGISVIILFVFVVKKKISAMKSSKIPVARITPV